MRFSIFILILVQFVACRLRGEDSALADTTVFAEMKVTRLLTDIHKTSVVFESNKARIRIDCKDGRQPTNIIMDVIAKVPPFDVHETFEGTNDFYCAGLTGVLLKDLKTGSVVNIELPHKIEEKAIGQSKYALVTVSDLIFVVPGENSKRSLVSNPGTIVLFESMETKKPSL